MTILLLSIAILILGYIFYSKYIDKVFETDENAATPAITYADGVDFVPLPKWKIFLIQFLNIAGLGPVTGAVLGAKFGPICFLWIVLGTIFAGGVHDFFSGFYSMRHQGKTTISNAKEYYGNIFKYFATICTIALLLTLGAYFAEGPAEMLTQIQTDTIPENIHTSLTFRMWMMIIFAYYFLSTFLPIDKIIGRFYPLFGASLFLITACLFVKLAINGFEINFKDLFVNLHPNKTPIFPALFVTISCGAISGFHATQSPLMARCISNERQARSVFYGAMVAESIVALIWATVGFVFYKSIPSTPNMDAPTIITAISNYFFGEKFAIFAILSVVILSITSGDTAFRSARLVIADWFNVNQKKVSKRLLLSIIVLGAGFAICKIDLKILWNNIGFFNHSIAIITLWIGCKYLKKFGRNYFVMLIPTIFVTSVYISFLLSLETPIIKNLTFSRKISVTTAVILGLIFTIYKREKYKRVNSRKKNHIQKKLIRKKKNDEIK